MEWTPEQIEATRRRILYDVSEEALARGRAERAHMAAWGRPKRCETNAVGVLGDCLFCAAANGESCRTEGG